MTVLCEVLIGLAWAREHAIELVGLAALATIGVGVWWLAPPWALIVVGGLMLADVIWIRAGRR